MFISILMFKDLCIVNNSYYYNHDLFSKVYKKLIKKDKYFKLNKLLKFKNKQKNKFQKTHII